MTFTRWQPVNPPLVSLFRHYTTAHAQISPSPCELRRFLKVASHFLPCHWLAKVFDRGPFDNVKGLRFRRATFLSPVKALYDIGLWQFYLKNLQSNVSPYSDSTIRLHIKNSFRPLNTPLLKTGWWSMLVEIQAIRGWGKCNKASILQ